MERGALEWLGAAARLLAAVACLAVGVVAGRLDAEGRAP